jgi:leucyl/phenylalanyl-tRNA---protein transferase
LLSVLDDKLWFPHPTQANEDGLLAIGGDLSEQRLLLAYKSGIFPWYNDDIPLWWHPNPRFVLLPHELKVSKSMQQIIARKTFNFSINNSFKEVVTNCKIVERKDQEGTWINNDVVEAYHHLHQKGYALSAEAWSNNDELVGGLYGIKIGNVFFGESMFSKVANASKFAFIQFVNYLIENNVVLIDCQVYTPHLESLGAKMIGREEFMKRLVENV